MSVKVFMLYKFGVKDRNIVRNNRLNTYLLDEILEYLTFTPVCKTRALIVLEIALKLLHKRFKVLPYYASFLLNTGWLLIKKH